MVAFCCSAETYRGGFLLYVTCNDIFLCLYCELVTSPDAVLRLIQEAGLQVVSIAERDERNVYLHRDFLIVVELIQK